MAPAIRVKRYIAIQVLVPILFVLYLHTDARCYGQLRLAETLQTDTNPQVHLIGAWKSIQVDPSLGIPGNDWLMIGKPTDITTDWQLPLKEGRVSAVSKGTMFAKLIGWSANRVSSLSFQFNPIRVDSGTYVNIPIYISGEFSHSYLLKYELNRNQDLKIWWFMDGPGVEQLLRSGQVQRDSPTGIAAKGVQALIDNSQGKDPLASFFPKAPTYTFRKGTTTESSDEIGVLSRNSDDVAEP